MSVFLETNHAFCRSPDAEGAKELRDAGFGAVFCNVGDYPPAEWEYMRDECKAAGVVCGPWLRTQGADRQFDPNRLTFLIEVADDWNPDDPVGICNSESEIKATGSDLTAYIARKIGGRDFAISMEVQPFGNVDWRPLSHLPVLPQNFPGETGRGDTDDYIREMWWNAGVTCVVITYGTYRGMQPTQFPRLDPYGIYTADDCGGNYQAWGSLGETTPCKKATPPKPEDDMTRIGSQDGIEATYNRLKAMDPEGCNPAFNPKQPAALPIDSLKAYDKWFRTMKILVQDHDAAV